MGTDSTNATKTYRMYHIQRVLLTVFVLNMIVAVAKYLYGRFSGSAAMQADGIHSIFDSAGNLVGVIGIALASRPMDHDHPYGHSKFETWTSVVIGVFLLLAAYEVGKGAIDRLVSGVFVANVTAISFVVMIGTLAMNIGVTLYERKQAEKLNSEILRADASHMFSDALVSLGVIVGLVFVKLGYPMADPLMALAVTVAILFAAFSVFKSAINTLSDHVQLDDDKIREQILTLPNVKGVHAVRSRGTDSEVYVDLHLLVDPDLTVQKAHDLTKLVEQQLKLRYKNVAEVLIHIEPDDGHVE